MIKVVTYKDNKPGQIGIPLEAHIFASIEEAQKTFPTVGITDKDFCGPMPDGDCERYDSWDAYNLLTR